MNDLTAFIEENEDDVVIEDVEVTDDEAITELVRYAIEGKPVSFRKVVNELLVARAGFVLEVLQEAIAADADGSDEDAEDKDNDESPELTEISKGLAGRYVKKASRDMADASATAVEADHQGDGDAAEANDRRWEKRDQGISRAVKRLTKESVSPVGKVTRADKGANVAVGNQGPRTIKKAAFSKKKPEQKSVSVAAGDTVRSQEAAD